MDYFIGILGVLLILVFALSIPAYVVVKITLIFKTAGAWREPSKSAEFEVRNRQLIFAFLILAGILGAGFNVMFYTSEHVTDISDRLTVIFAPLPQLLWFSKLRSSVLPVFLIVIGSSVPSLLLVPALIELIRYQFR